MLTHRHLTPLHRVLLAGGPAIYRCLLGSVVGGFMCVLASHAAQADSFNNRFYGGLGIGQSTLNPDPLDTGYRVTGKQGDTATLFLGWDYSARWSIEAHFDALGDAQLGQAEGQNLNPASGTVDYENLGISALAYFYNRDGVDGLFDRSGLSLFAGAGIGALKTGSSNLPVRQLEDLQLTLTAGVEYGLPSGWAGRAQLNALDRDAIALTLRLMYRFGGSDRQAKLAESPPVVTEIVEAPVIVEPTVIAEPVIAEPIEPVTLDSDTDGVPDQFDDCAQTPSGQPVNAQGCPVFDGRIDGVTFAAGSDRLTANARNVLDDAAAQLLLYPDIRVAIMAHTDNVGSASGNLALSKRRAVSVAKYLIARGVDSNRLQPTAFGESKPVASNGDAVGRELNRRVEFRTLQ